MISTSCWLKEEKQMVDLKQIQYFVTCAQAGSFSRAAENLYTTQPSVSKVIKAMEEEMNIRLFERYAKGIGLTSDGERIYYYAKLVLDNIEKMQNPVQGTNKEQLLVSSSPNAWFSDRFLEFYHDHEQDNLHYQIYSADMHEIVKRVQDRTDDIGFVDVMKNQFAAFQYYISRNYLEFEPLLQTHVMLYQGKNEKSDSGSLKQEIKFSELRLIQHFPDEFSADHYREIQDQYGNSVSDAETVVTTNSDYIMNRLLQTSNLANIRGAFLTGHLYDDTAAIRVSAGEDGTVLYGFLHRRGEELSRWAVTLVEFLKNKIDNKM